MAMTMNQFYEAVANGVINNDVKAIAQRYADKAAEKRNERNSKVAAIMDAVSETPQTLAEIAEKCGYSWQSVSGILSRELKAGARLVQGTNEDGKRTYART